MDIGGIVATRQFIGKGTEVLRRHLHEEEDPQDAGRGGILPVFRGRNILGPGRLAQQADRRLLIQADQSLGAWMLRYRMRWRWQGKRWRQGRRQRFSGCRQRFGQGSGGRHHYDRSGLRTGSLLRLLRRCFALWRGGGVGSGWCRGLLPSGQSGGGGRPRGGGGLVFSLYGGPGQNAAGGGCPR